MTHCTKPACKLSAWRKRLCFTHWRESQGFVFDRTLKVFRKPRHRRCANGGPPAPHELRVEDFVRNS
jgi:hypothetical protein